MSQIKFSQQDASATNPMTIIEYATYSGRADLSERLTKAWDGLAGAVSDGSSATDEAQISQKLAVHNNDGARLYDKFFRSHLKYEERAPDTLSKMLGMLKPCATSYIDFKANKMFMSFNETLSVAREPVIRGKFRDMLEASKANGEVLIAKKIHVFSGTVYMQEYKIVDKYFEFCDFLDTIIDTYQIEFIDIELFENLFSFLKQYYASIKNYRNDFNKTTDELPDHTNLLQAVNEFIASSRIDMPESLLAPHINQDELGVCFMKMRVLFKHLIEIIPEDYSEAQESLFSKYYEFDMTFCKALDGPC